MLHINMDHSQTESAATPSGKKNPFDFFSNIFRRKNKGSETDGTDRSEESLVGSESRLTPENRAHQRSPIFASPQNWNEVNSYDGMFSRSPVSPRKGKTIHQDMEALRLSRGDNPYIQQKLEKISCYEEGFSSPSKSDQEKLVENDGSPCDEEIDENLHAHLIRSPPPHFPRTIAEFVFPDKSDSPRHRPKDTQSGVYPTETTFTASPGIRSQYTSPQIGTRSLLTSLPSVEALQKRDTKKTKDLNPLLCKPCMEVIDPGIKEILQSQKKKFFSSHKRDLNHRDRGPEVILTPQRTMACVSSRPKWSPAVIPCPVSYLPSPALTVTSSISMPGLNGLSGGEEHELPRSLAPLKGVKIKSGSLLASSSVQDLGAPSTSYGSKRESKATSRSLVSGTKFGSKESLLKTTIE
ncbi:uncharacterized protein LOC143254123 isoform X2 [Tachypleus tridentatus]|uniref:uncharacterized protein LOC143254123 isoform X2 n=1 Tax=Tachypleus tridentatus TaxID=6853 RepID=UPI003FD69EBE